MSKAKIDRGLEWKKALRRAKFEADANPTMLKATRFKAGLSQDEVVSRSSIKHKAVFSKIENGKTMVSEKRAKELSKLYKKPMKSLFVNIKPGRYLAV